jgi:anti-anti-sigma factor
VGAAQFSVARDGDVTVVTAAGELDLAVKDDLRDVLAPLTGSVVIDLADVTFVDSSTLGVLVGAHKRLTGDGGTLRVRAPQDMPRLTFETVGLASWIED